MNIKKRGRCTIPGCDRIHQARGWCLYHWKKWYRWGEPTEPSHRGRSWTEKEEAQILALIPPGGGRFPLGLTEDLALMLERSKSAVRVRTHILRKRLREGFGERL